MKRTTFFSVAMLLGAVAGCGNNQPQNMDLCASVTCVTGATCNATTGMCENPAFPSLAAAVPIDRLGRPGINTALTNPFGLFVPAGAATPQTSDATKDEYNIDHANVATNWANWIPAVAFNLQFLDALNTNGAASGCGDQLAFDGAGPGSGYTLLAGVLAGDALQVNTTNKDCQQYLGVEANELGVANTDCGGRTLSEDVIETTYSALVAGNALIAAGVGLSTIDDGITETTVPSATFPFMTAPK